MLTVYLFIDPVSHRGAITYSISIPNGNGDQSAPFDQKSYLLISFADGGSSSYFPEGLGNKPWSDFSPYAVNKFWDQVGVEEGSQFRRD